MVRHILKDGTVLKDITGYVVKKKDVPNVYAVIMNCKKKGEEKCRK